jgi:hypothetical protein
MQIAAAAALEQLVQSIVASRKLLIMGTAAPYVSRRHSRHKLKF